MQPPKLIKELTKVTTYVYHIWLKLTSISSSSNLEIKLLYCKDERGSLTDTTESKAQSLIQNSKPIDVTF